MKEEFNLSNKIMKNPNPEEDNFIQVFDVKDFIKKLKEEFAKSYGLATQWVYDENVRIIDKLAGDKLK